MKHKRNKSMNVSLKQCTQKIFEKRQKDEMTLTFFELCKWTMTFLINNITKHKKNVL